MSLIGFKAQNHPQQDVKPDVDDRRTPPDLLTECAELAGVDFFNLDAAATADNAKASQFYTAEDDGLAQRWFGKVWCNPPYSDIGPWVRKAWVERRYCHTIVMLLPANRTEQKWWQDLIEPGRRAGTIAVYFLAGRRRFDRPGWTKPAKGDRPPFGLCLVVWGPR